MSGTKNWICWLQHYPKRSFNWREELRGPNFFRWFYWCSWGLKYISWQKNSKVIQLLLHIADPENIIGHLIRWSYMERKTQDLRKYAGLTLNQLTTKYPERYFNLSYTLHCSNFTRHLQSWTDLELTSYLVMVNP